jgi:hypothetical protein
MCPLPDITWPRVYLESVKGLLLYMSSGPVLHPRLEWIDFTHPKGILPSSFHSYPLSQTMPEKKEKH